jgi:hypothetical protein
MKIRSLFALVAGCCVAFWATATPARASQPAVWRTAQTEQHLSRLFRLEVLRREKAHNETVKLETGKTYTYSVRTESFSILRLRWRRSGQLIWKRILPYPGTVGWSQDGNALAIQEEPLSNRVLVWWRGYRPRTFHVKARVYDDVSSFLWSPDNRRLLLFTTSRGQGDLGVGSVFCLNLNTGQTQEILIRQNKNIRRVQWIGRRKVRVWTKRYGGKYELVDNPKPVLWLAT